MALILLGHLHSRFLSEEYNKFDKCQYLHTGCIADIPILSLLDIHTPPHCRLYIYVCHDKKDIHQACIRSIVVAIFQLFYHSYPLLQRNRLDTNSSPQYHS